jgi:hypothetical protein
MIDVHDLCVGNWVYDGNTTQFPMFIRTIGEDYVYLDFEENEGDLWESKPEDLYGIPLSEDLLSKVGLHQTGSVWEHPELYFEVDFNIEKGVYYPSYNWAEYYIAKPIKYLHELQNLFWNITKQQLKVDIW